MAAVVDVLLLLLLSSLPTPTPPRKEKQFFGQGVTQVAPAPAQHEIAVDVAHFAVKALLVLLHFVNQTLQQTVAL